MRIGVDARPLALPATGIGRYTSEILRRLVSTNHQLFLYSHTPFLFDPAENVTIRTGRLRSGPMGSIYAQYQYPRWIRKDALDVFWSPRHHLPIFTSVPTVVTIHDLVWRKSPDSMIALGRTLERALMPPSLRKARAVIAVSDATRRDIVEFLPSTAEKTTTIHEASFQPTCAPKPTGRTGTILFVGTFEPRKNIPGLLRAFAQLIGEEKNDHRLVLAGKPGWKEDISGLIQQLGLTERVTIKQSKSQAELEDLYRSCDFLVQPAFYEGFCLPILEAMAFGKPVITSNCSSMPEVAGNAALLVQPDSVEEIVAAMKRLIDDEALYQTLSARAFKQAARFSWDTAAAATLRIIESVVASPNTG